MAKLESFSPLPCVKEGIALGMVVAAERQGLIPEGSLIAQPTSGNTGIGPAMVCAGRGYRLSADGTRGEGCGPLPAFLVRA